MSFTAEELAYLSSQGMARFATVDEAAQPDVVPVALEFDGTYFWVGSVGEDMRATRKARNITAGHRKVALVVDDLVSLAPFIARGIRVYGIADGPVERTCMVGPGHYLRVTPRMSWSWNLAGEPVGATWYPARRAEHAAPAGA